MSSLDQLRTRLAGISDTEEYKVQHVISDITEDLVERMEVLAMTRQDLANALGVTPAMVTKLLRGQNNFTVRTLVQIADALGCTVSVKLPPCGFRAVPYFISDGSDASAEVADFEYAEDSWILAAEVA